MVKTKRLKMEELKRQISHGLTQLKEKESVNTKSKISDVAFIDLPTRKRR